MNTEQLLVGIILVQQAFYMWQIQKLIDKAKSSSYTEYVNATKPKEIRVPLPKGTPEDLGPLSEFNQLI